MKVLVITNLFPNKSEPTRGVYNKQLVAELAGLCDLKVIAPLPWVPRGAIFLKSIAHRDIPEKETIDGIEVFHPQYFMIPKFGRVMYGFYFFLSLYGKIKEVRSDFKFDLIFAPWVFPDGVGSFFIARMLKVPIIIEALGSDINIFTRFILRRKIISYVLQRSAKVIAVSNELKNVIIKIGVPAKNVEVVTNGVNTNLFCKMDKTLARERLNLTQDVKIILFVGNLVPVKGIEYLMDSYNIVAADNKNIRLVIIGDGFLKSLLLKKVSDFKLEKKMVFCGKMPHEDIPMWMNGCDVLCLPSLDEGYPNVILEAMACGIPIVATRVGGIPEMVNLYESAELVDPKDINQLSAALEKAIRKVEIQKKDSDKISAKSWNDAAKEIFFEFKKIINK